MDAARERLDWTRDWDGEEQAQLSRRDLLEAYLNPDDWEELARAFIRFETARFGCMFPYGDTPIDDVIRCMHALADTEDGVLCDSVFVELALAMLVPLSALMYADRPALAVARPFFNSGHLTERARLAIAEGRLDAADLGRRMAEGNAAIVTLFGWLDGARAVEDPENGAVLGVDGGDEKARDNALDLLMELHHL